MGLGVGTWPQKIRVSGVSRVMFGCAKAWVVFMATPPGCRKRPNGTGLNAKATTIRLNPDSWQVANNAAQALGISRDAFFDGLLAWSSTQVDAQGRPMWWSQLVSDDDRERPLRTA